MPPITCPPRKLAALLAGLVVVALVAGCADTGDNGSSGAIPSIRVDLTGTWTGTFESTAGPAHSGTVTFTFDAQAANGALSGSSVFTTIVGEPTCFEEGEMLGLSVEATLLSGEVLRKNSGVPAVNPKIVTVEMDHLLNVLRGAYTTSLETGSPCTGEAGVLALNRS